MQLRAQLATSKQAGYCRAVGHYLKLPTRKIGLKVVYSLQHSHALPFGGTSTRICTGEPVLAKAITREVPLMVCMGSAPTPIALSSVCSSNVLSRSGNASTVAEARVERKD